MKVYKKRYKLKMWVKELLLIALMFAIVLVATFGFIDRMEKINNGEMNEQKSIEHIDNK